VKKLLTSIYTSQKVRSDIYDVIKVIVGIVAAKYGLKLA
jgi:hypothetical protein